MAHLLVGEWRLSPWASGERQLARGTATAHSGDRPDNVALFCLALFCLSVFRSGFELTPGPVLRSVADSPLMIIVAGFIDVDPPVRAEFLEAMREAIVATHSEPGCIEYTFAADAVEPGRVRLFERWESKDDLLTHLALSAKQPSPVSATFERAAVELAQYEISAHGPLGS
jgi:quinol monooxygenase YgiN